MFSIGPKSGRFTNDHQMKYNTKNDLCSPGSVINMNVIVLEIKKSVRIF